MTGSGPSVNGTSGASSFDGTVTREDALERLAELEETLRQHALERAKDRQRITELESRVDDLEAETERLRTRLSDSGGKAEKVAAIVHYAQNKRSGQPVVQLDAEEVKGATGCSRRYSYDLLDTLPDEYDWILSQDEIRQYGELELDTGKMPKRLGVDFEGVHTTPVPVHLFTTRVGGDPDS